MKQKLQLQRTLVQTLDIEVEAETVEDAIELVDAILDADDTFYDDQTWSDGEQEGFIDVVDNTDVEADEAEDDDTPDPNAAPGGAL